MIFEKVNEDDYFLWGKTKEKRVCKCYIKIVTIFNSSWIIAKKSKKLIDTYRMFSKNPLLLKTNHALQFIIYVDSLAMKSSSPRASKVSWVLALIYPWLTGIGTMPPEYLPVLN